MTYQYQRELNTTETEIVNAAAAEATRGLAAQYQRNPLPGDPPTPTAKDILDQGIDGLLGEDLAQALQGRMSRLLEHLTQFPLSDRAQALNRIDQQLPVSPGP